MSEREQLYTGKQLVERLAELGVGRWSAAAVRRWIHEEVPCPIAERGLNGQGHRYRLRDVVQWLMDRAERAGDRLEAGDAVLDMLSQASHLAQREGQPATPARATSDDLPVAPAGEGRSQLRDRVSAAKAAGHPDPDLLDVMLEVIGGRDPKNWKATEEALSLRTKRLREAGHLIPDTELQRCMETQQSLFLGALAGLRAQLKAAMTGASNDAERARIVDREFDAALERLADQVGDDDETIEEAA